MRLLTQWMRDAGYFTANLRTLPAACGFKGTGKTDWNFDYSPEPFDSADWGDLKSRQPFYAQINFHETHRKFNGEQRVDPAKVEIPPYEPDHSITRQDRARYLDAATELDRKVGRVLAHWRRMGWRLTPSSSSSATMASRASAANSSVTKRACMSP